jgi:hypothetical protein
MPKRVFVAVLLAVVLTAGCPKRFPMDIPGVTAPRASDEMRIAAVLNDVDEGMRQRRIFKVLAHVSRTYHDDEGRNYQGIQEYLKTVFDKYRSIRITRVPPQIVVQGDRARATETFGTIAEPVDAQEMPPVNLQGQVLVYLERTNGQWLITEWSSAQ